MKPIKSSFESHATRLPNLRSVGLAIVLVVTIATLWLVWSDQQRPIIAEAQLPIFGEKPPVSVHRLKSARKEIRSRHFIALSKSYFVIQAAIRDHDLLAIPILARQSDAIQWLQDHIDEELVPCRDDQNRACAAIQVRGIKADAAELCKIAEAIAGAYHRQVLRASLMRKLKLHDALAKLILSVSKDIDMHTKSRELIDNSSHESPATAKSTLSLETLRAQLASLTDRKNAIDAEIGADDRVDAEITRAVVRLQDQE